LCILKDVLQHWKLENIYTLLDYIVSKYKYIIIVNCRMQTEDNSDMSRDGDCRGLSADFLPLKKYNPVKLALYNTKEISLITRD